MGFILRNAAAAIVRWTVGVAIAAVCMIFGFVPSRALATFIGSPPPWLESPLVRIGVVVFGVLIILFIFIWDRRVRPKFRATFNADRDVHKLVPLINLATGMPLGINSSYVHLQVSAKGGANIAQCEGWITCLEELDKKGKTIRRIDESRHLIWAPREKNESKVPIVPGISRDLDIFRTIQSQNTLELLSIGHSQRWISFFSSPGIYRLTLNVVGDGAKISRRLTIEWKGQWNNFVVI
jgi:hypothetical protein